MSTTEQRAAPSSPGWEDGELVIERTFAAPRELVFRAWTEAGHFARWYGPKGSTLHVVAMDARPGGAFHYRHRFPDYPDVWVGGVYDEVRAPERLAYRVFFADEGGRRVERPGYPPEMRIAVDFAHDAGGTRVTIRHAGLPEDRGEVQGWTESLERLDALLIQSPNQAGDAEMITSTIGTGPAAASAAPDNREGVAVRTFDAPRELVWEVMTRPEHLKRWYGPRGMELVACEIDLRPGGAFRYVLRGPDGGDFAFSGTYREVDPPSRLVNSWGWEGMPGHVATETATLTEHGGKTTVRMSIVFATPEDYQGWAGAGAYTGWSESLERLSELVAELA